MNQKKSSPVDPIPQRVPLDRLFLWPNNPRLASVEWPGPAADTEIKNPEVQTQCLRRVREADDGEHLSELIISIGSQGLLGNPGAPIAVCALGGGDFVVIDGNARVVAVRDLLRYKQWLRKNVEYAEKLRAGIEVMEFGPWSDRDVKLAIMKHTARIHMLDTDDSGIGFERPLDDR